MVDKDIKKLQLQVGNLCSQFTKKNKKLSLGIKKLQLDIKDLQKGKSARTPDGKKKLKSLQLDLKKSIVALEKKSRSLELDLKKLTLPPDAPKKEVILLPKSLNNIIKKGGIEITDGVTVLPDIQIDFKNMKIKKAGIKFKWVF